MPLRWKSFRTEAEVKQMLASLLPLGSDAAAVHERMLQQGCQCSALVEGTVYCSAPARSGLFFTQAKWLIELRFRNDRLVGIDVTKGLTGP